MSVSIPLELQKLLYIKKDNNASMSSQVSELRKIYSTGLIKQLQIYETEKIKKKYVMKNHLTKEIKKSLIEIQNAKQEEQRALSRERNLIIMKRRDLETVLENYSETNNALLTGISNKISHHMQSQKKTEKLLGTIMLQAPTTNKKLRIKLNSESKPVYMSTMASLLIKDLIENGHTFESQYIQEIVSNLNIPNKQDTKITETEENFEVLSTKLFSQITQGIYIHQLGLQSESSQKILKEKKGDNSEISKEQRCEFLKQSSKISLEFLIFGISAQRPKLDTKEQETEWKKKVRKELNFKSEVIKSINHANGEIGEILKVCQLYTSLMLQDKEHEQQGLENYAYKIMKSRSEQGKLNQQFCEKLLNIMGQFPIGSGLFMMNQTLPGHKDKNPNLIEKAIVTKIYPKNPQEPFIKKVTRNELYYKYEEQGTLIKCENLTFNFNKLSPLKQKNFKQQYSPDQEKANRFWKPNDIFNSRISEKNLWN